MSDVSESAVEFAIKFLEEQGYVVAKPGDPPPEVEYSIHDKLRSRMECLASDLQIIDGVSKKGGVLDPAYRAQTLPSINRYIQRIMSALASGEPVKNEWDHDKT